MTDVVLLTDAQGKIHRYMERRGTAAPADEVRDRLRDAFAEYDRFIAGLSEAQASAAPAAGGRSGAAGPEDGRSGAAGPEDGRSGAAGPENAWSARDVADHLLESDRGSLEEFRCLVAGERPPGPPLAASLRSLAPHRRPWDWLVRESVAVHADILETCRGGGDRAEGEATAEIVIVVSGASETGEVVEAEWTVEADWRAYAACLRVHTREHLDQIRAGLSVPA